MSLFQFSVSSFFIFQMENDDNQTQMVSVRSIFGFHGPIDFNFSGCVYERIARDKMREKIVIESIF